MTGLRRDGPDAAALAETSLLDAMLCGVLRIRDDGKIVWANRTFRDWADACGTAGVRTVQEALTTPSRMLFETHVRPSLRLGHRVSEVLCQMRSAHGQVRPVLLSVRQAGEEGFLLTLFEASERARYEQALRASEAQAAQLAAIVTSSPDAMLTLDPQGRILTVNQAAGFAVGQDVREGINCDDAADWLASAAPDLRGGDVVRRAGSLVSTAREVEITIATLQGDSPDLMGQLSVVLRDVSEQKRSERHLRLVVRELNHRVKNNLAVVGSIASFTFQGLDRADQSVRAFRQRLTTLAAAHDLMTERHWADAELRALLERTVEAGADPSRFAFSGPAVHVDQQQAVNLAMAFHELTTNAIKYGALSRAAGRVSVAWRVDDASENGGSPLVRAEWRETGGPTVTPPDETGFGTMLIERSLSLALGATVGIDYAPAGLRCAISFPLSLRANGGSLPEAPEQEQDQAAARL